FFFNGDEANEETFFNALDDQINGSFPVFEATASNPTGCITIIYVPTANSPGWQAFISCEPACQPVIASLASSVPEVFPADTGYIDLCIGEEFTLTGTGIFPENNLIYEQSDENSSFEWNFDDGSTATGTTVTHSYDEPGGYTVQLTITDQNGCSNLNQINQRIRVAPRPSFFEQVPIVDVICIGDTVKLRGSTQFNPNPNSEVFVTTEQQSFSAQQQISETTFLPDGSGVEYSTSLEFSNFGNGQVLSSADDLEAICLNMEHSFVGDLDIWLQCPNGTEVRLVEFGFNNLNGQFLGEPIDDESLTPGVGFDYCFKNSADFTWDQAVVELDIGGDESIPAGDYAPVESLTTLMGCPLNGEWTIRVRDNLGIDNGYIFSWGLEFNDYLFPDLELFDVGFAQAFWNDDQDLVFYSEDSICSVPTAAGTVDYTYTVVDAFGCVSDTTIEIEVLPYSHPDCYACTPLLESTSQVVNTQPGTEVQTNLAVATQTDTAVLFRATENDPFGQSLYSNFGRAYRSSINVNSIAPEPIMSVDQIESICVNLETEEVGGVRLFLITPNDLLFELSTGNGGDGSNFINTCFTPSATTSIMDAEPPFTGEFLPEGNFDNLIGATVTGEWAIVAWSVASGAPLGNFIDWSIEFRHMVPLTYSWTPDDGSLSCTDCPNPVITAGPDGGVYTLNVVDDYGCTDIGTVTINTNISVDVEVTGTDLICNSDNSGTATVTASGGTEPYTYLWSNDETTQTIEGLAAGDYSVTVTDTNGTTEVGSVTITQPEDIMVTSADIGNVSCFGDTDGFINITITGGTGDYTIIWNGQPGTQNLDNIPAGQYTLLITDSVGCTSLDTLTVTEPAVLVGDLNVTNIACGSSGAGAIDLSVSGGTEPYTYAWSNGAETEDVSDLPAGDYTVTATDANGCTISLTGSVSQPASLEITSTVVDVACNGENTGSIDVEVDGGTEPYAYMWSNEEETQDIDGLAAGVYSLTITDGNGCTAEMEYEVSEPTALMVELTSSDLSCAGDNTGSIDLTATGGTPDYNYLWNDGETTEDRLGLAPGAYEVTVTDQNGCFAIIATEITEPEELGLSATVSGIACGSGGDVGGIDLTVSGGTPDYTFAWSNGAETEDLIDVPAGEYEVLVTDANGCTVTEVYQITQPDALDLSTTVISLACAGDNSGSVTLEVAGGTMPYTFAWSNGAETQDIDGLSAGVYSVVVTDANSCSDSVSVEVTEPAALTLEIAGMDLLCSGDNSGSIDLTIAGGTGAYSIIWNDGATDEDRTGLSGGTYSVMVTDENGCTAEAEISLTEPDPILLAVVTTDLGCAGDNSGAIDLSVEGGTPPAGFEWSNGATTEDIANLAAGTYSVTVTDVNGCTNTISATISEPAELMLSFSTVDVLCAGETTGSIDLEVTGGTAPFGVSWSNGGATEDLSDIPAGSYVAVVTDANGCTITSDEISITEPEPLSCTVIITAESLNGNDGALSATVEGGTGPYTYQWDDVLASTTPDITDLAPGVYTLTVTDANGCETVCSAELLAYAIVGDFVFFDRDRDGIQDAGEVGINNIPVIITGVTNGVSESTVTVNGFYQFNVLPGEYRITFGRPSGFEASPQDQTEESSDSDIDVFTLTTDVFTLVASTENLDIDAGFFDPCIPGLDFAGTIGEDQELCGPGNVPALLFEVSPATGAVEDGVINYMWMMTTGDPVATPVNNWTPIPNSNSPNYQPGQLFETTYFARCVRIDQCPFLESNIIEIFVGDEATANITGPSTTCEFEEVTYTATDLATSSDISWDVTGPATVLATTDNSITVRWGSFGRFTVSLSVMANGCMATSSRDVFVSRNCSTPLGGINTGNEALTETIVADELSSRVYPNPATNVEASLELLSGYSYEDDVRLQIFDATGRQVTERNIQGGQRVIKLSSLHDRATGIYIIRLTQGEASETHRLILR
ncbi:MAG: SdrD B-like domain-containing protein, partial [Bacteroidota bacterium]